MKTYPAHSAKVFFLFTAAVPVWDLLLCIFDSYSVRAVLRWGVMNCVSAITIVFHTNWLCSAWKEDIISTCSYFPVS